MKNNRLGRFARSIALVMLLVPTLANSALINRGSGMVYDNVLGITWLMDANYMRTSGNHGTGMVDYTTASSWVSNLIYGGYSDWRLPTTSPVNGSTWNTNYTLDGSSDRGYNNTGQNNELGYMLVQNLNNNPYYSAAGFCCQPGSNAFNSSFTDGDSGLTYSFSNIMDNYWLSPPNVPWAGASWGFNMKNFSGIVLGEQNVWSNSSGLAVWAVRNGDVASTLSTSGGTGGSSGSGGSGGSSGTGVNTTNAIPEPPLAALLGFGLAGLLAARRQAKAS